MKMPLEWHKDCLRNLISSFEDAQRAAEHAGARRDWLGRQTVILQYQIKEAENAGMNEFDADRFRKKRNDAKRA